MFRYCSRTWRFEYFLASRKARRISFSLRFTSRFDVRMRCLTSCWVIVDPPWTIWPDEMFRTAARNTPLRSMPSLLQNVLSSTAITAFCRIFGTSSRLTSSRFWVPSWPIWAPVASYTVDRWASARS